MSEYNASYLKELRIYVSDGTYFKRGRLLNTNENEYSLLLNNAKYIYDEESDLFVKKDGVWNIDIKDENGKDWPVVNYIADYQNNIIERCCLVVSVSDIAGCSIDRLSFVIERLLKRAYIFQKEEDSDDVEKIEISKETITDRQQQRYV